jgi:hypothetical protein
LRQDLCHELKLDALRERLSRLDRRGERLGFHWMEVAVPKAIVSVADSWNAACAIRQALRLTRDHVPSRFPAAPALPGGATQIAAEFTAPPRVMIRKNAPALQAAAARRSKIADDHRPQSSCRTGAL